MKAFITKYALTNGIIESKILSVENGYCITTKLYNAIATKYVHQEFEQALAQAEQMRAKKIKSLEKQIEKLKQLEFKKP